MVRLLILLFLPFVACKSSFQTEVSFYSDELGHIYVPIHCAGIELRANFDTGAPLSMFSDSIFKKLNLTKDTIKYTITYLGFLSEPFTSYITKLTPLYINGLTTGKEIYFGIKPNHIGEPVTLGFNTIEQFNWLFDFNKMTVKISTEDIAFDKEDAVKIPYYKKGLYIYCVLAINKWIYTQDQERPLIDDVMIDTGGGACMARDSIFTTYLELQNNPTNGQLMFQGKALDKAVLELSNDNELFINRDSISVLYNGLVVVNSFDDPSNGRLSLGNTYRHSQMYLDTKNRIIYLKK